MNPPIVSNCIGFGQFVLSDDETRVDYDITFDPWVNDEFAAHIHELLPPPGGEFILTDLELGQHKVGYFLVEKQDVDALRSERLFAMVHTVEHMTGEVRGFLILATPVRPSTWGQLKAIYR